MCKNNMKGNRWYKMFSAHLGQPSEGQLCAKAELERPLVVTHTPFLVWPGSRP